MKNIFLILMLSTFVISCNKTNDDSNNIVKVKTNKTVKTVKKGFRHRNNTDNSNRLQKDEFIKINTANSTDISELLKIQALKGSFYLKDEVKEVGFVVQFYSNNNLKKTQGGITNKAHDDKKIMIGKTDFSFYIIDKSKTRLKTDVNTGFEFSYGIQTTRKTKYGSSRSGYFDDDTYFTKEEFDFDRFSHAEAFREKHYEGDLLPIAYIVGYGSDCPKCGRRSYHGLRSKEELINNLDYQKEDYKLIIFAVKVKK